MRFFTAGIAKRASCWVFLFGGLHPHCGPSPHHHGGIVANVVAAFQPPFPQTTRRTAAQQSWPYSSSLREREDDDSPILIPEAEIKSWRKDFWSFLKDRVTAQGNFYAYEVKRNVALQSLPVIQVVTDDKDNDIGTIGYPLSTKQASDLIHGSFTKASRFGMGADTLLDDSVRKSWEIEPSDVTFLNGETKDEDEWEGDDETWDAKLKSIANEAVKALGVKQDDRHQVSHKLHKVLLYEEGSFFKPHRDAVKEDGMFATLAIQLPSRFEGGSMVFEHRGAKQRVDLAGSSRTCLKWIAWYADCLHEIEPVTSGYRFVLVYNLMMKTRTGTASAEKEDLKKDDDSDDAACGDLVQQPPFALSEEDMATFQRLVVDWKKRIESRIVNEKLPKRDDLKWVDNDFVNDMYFVHKLDHLYTASGWGGVVEKFMENPWDNIGATQRLELFKLLGPHESRDLSPLKGRDRNVVELLSKVPVEVKLVIQDYAMYGSGEEGWDFHLERMGEDGEYNLPLWCVSPTDDERYNEFSEFEVVPDGEQRGGYCESLEGWETANIPSIYLVGNEGQCGNTRFRVAFLIIRPKLGMDESKQL